MDAASFDGMTGFRFHPTDQELVSHFLRKKVVDRDPLTPYSNCVFEFDLFGDAEPWVIWDRFARGPRIFDQELYFFSALKKLGPKDSRIKRKIASGGTWSETETFSNVQDQENEKTIGHKRKFRYENSGCEHHCGWLLDEYSLAADRQQAMNIVLCRLRKNPRKKPTQESKKKPKSKRARKESEEAQNCSSSILNSSFVTFDETSTMNNGNDQDQGLITGDASYGGVSNLLAGSDSIYFGNSDATDEEYLFDIEELLEPYNLQSPWLQELPQMDENQVMSLPAASEFGADHGMLEARGSSGMENLCNQPLGDIAYWPGTLMDELMRN